LLDGLFGMFRGRGGCGCCEPSCCCDSGCGCGDSCGCGGYSNGHGDDVPAAPAEAGAQYRPIPPRPMADPNASVGYQRNVVRTSFVR